MDFIIVHQTLSIVNRQVVAGTHNYLTVNARFKGDDWTGLRKWVHFIAGEGAAEYILPMTDDRITEDQHLDLTGGTWKVYIHGNYLEDDDVTERITTNKEYLYVEGDDNGHPFPPLTPEFEEVLANQVMEAKDIAQSVRDDADAGEFDGATFTPDVSDDGDISWTNDKGKENPPTKNIKGPKGDTGESGVYIGTTEPTDPVKEVWINPEGDPGFVFVGEVETTGTHQPGTYDTYTLHRDNGEDLVIRVYNGADGSGIGDMVKAAYDPQNKATDIFDYADDAVEALHDDLASVAFSGSYNDLTNKPAPPVIDTQISSTSTNAVQNKVIKAALDEKADTEDLADVAFSGDYDDLSNKPTIPPAITVDADLSATSTNPVQNKVIQAALQQKQDKITIDSAMSGTSTNPVQNKAIKQYIDSNTTGTIEVRSQTYNSVPSETIPANSAFTKTINVVPISGQTARGIVGVLCDNEDLIIDRACLINSGTQIVLHGYNMGSIATGLGVMIHIIYMRNAQ